jgi:hypothetical protein
MTTPDQTRPDQTSMELYSDLSATSDHMICVPQEQFRFHIYSQDLYSTKTI